MKDGKDWVLAILFCLTAAVFANHTLDLRVGPLDRIEEFLAGGGWYWGGQVPPDCEAGERFQREWWVKRERALSAQALGKGELEDQFRREMDELLNQARLACD